jgi:flagellar assembly protein FliH
MSRDTVILRGHDAERAQPLIFGNEVPAGEVMATGPWADTYNQVRAAAHDRGYREGLAEGLRDGLAEGAEEVRRRSSSAVDALDRAAEQLADAERATIGDLAPQVVELALELTRLILGREVAATEDPGLDALARILPLVPERGELAVRMHPEDLRTLGQYQVLVPGRQVDFVADHTLERGDAVVDVGSCRIDGRLDGAWERVAAVLRAGEPVR